MEKKNGIAIAGTVIVDRINEISAYPASGELTQILGIQKAIGGCVPNVALDLKKISPALPVRVFGRVGSDADGTFVRQTLDDAGLDTTGLLTDENAPTSFTEVMSVTGGQRTFFTYSGASAAFGAEDVDFGEELPEILHLGYFLLLQKVDDGDGVEILKAAQARGIRTSIDLVSENSDRYGLVKPCLPYTDYLIVNELEAGMLTGIEPTNDNLQEIAEKLKELGVREKVVIHKPDCAVCLSDAGFTCLPSYALPAGYIKGTTGAGDAFCAGALYGIYKNWPDAQILEFASATAVMALGSADATSGLVDEQSIKEFCANLPKQKVTL